MRIATIDIGSNTILMLICEKHKNGKIDVIRDEYGIARLSENIKSTKNISKTAINRAVEILKNFIKTCGNLSVEKIVAVATSAMREAENSQEVADIFRDILKDTNYNFSIISGEQEAEYSFLGSVTSANPTTVIDIGGGSTELIFGKNCKIIHKVSIPIGVVKIKEELKLSQPLSKNQIKAVRQYIQNYLTNIEPSLFYGDIVAVAGTPTTLASIALNLKHYDAVRVQNFMFDEIIFNNVKNNVLNATIDELICKYNVDNLRADVLSVGTILLEELLIFMNKNSFFVNIYGLRYGVALLHNIMAD